METVRLRLAFDKTLSRSQKTDGLKRCWILLKPQHKTISDLSFYILSTFELRNACPNGIVLSMDGFALPAFESTSILSDKDIIRVKKRVEKVDEIVKVDDVDGKDEMLEIVELPPEATTRMNLLVNEEFDKESGGYETEPDEDVPDEPAEDALDVENTPQQFQKISKKRKASKELRKSNSKRKKNKSASAEKSKAVSEDVRNEVIAVQNDTLGSEKRSPCHVEHEGECGLQHMKKRGLFAAYKDCVNGSSKEIRSSLPQGNGHGSDDTSCTPSGSKKLPSRNARRKKARRLWLREKIKAEKKEKQLLEKANQQSHGKYNHKALEGPSKKVNHIQLLENVNQQSSEKDNHKVLEEPSERGNNNEIHQKDESKLKEDCHPESDADDDIVPIVIRPGHIRFEPLSKVGTDQTMQQTMQQYQIPVETFRWNGTTSKKKGQKWGKEKVACQRNDYNKSVNQECVRTLTIQEKMPVCDPINFEKLAPYTSLPKEGDVIAYRVIELSSSWTPELSSYRVGKISRYHLESNIVVLLPVPEYSMISEEKIDGETSNLLQETSTHREDGSVEIKFSLLIDVRLVNHGNQNSAKPTVSGHNNEVCNRNQDTGTHFWSSNSNGAHSSVQENGEVHAWEEIKQALTAKKAQLTQEDNWSKAERAQPTQEDNWSKAEREQLAKEDNWSRAESSGGRKPWSYRALRGSALGPTMALLRAQNGL